MEMDNAVQNNDRQAISTSHSSDDQFRNRLQSMRGSPGSSLFRLRGGSKPIREMDRSDMEKLELDLPKRKAVALSPKSSVPPHLLMTALLEQLCHMYVPNDKKVANEVFMLLCENLSQLNVISSLSHLDEMRLLRKQHGITFKRLLGAALHSIKQTQMARALTTGSEVPLNPVPSKGEKILRQEELMDEFLSRYEEEFEELHHLGSGGFGSVYKVRHKLDKRCYAIKKIRFKQKDHELLTKLLREVRVLAQLQHTNIVGYNSTWIESHNPFSSSKGTSAENTTSQGISPTDIPWDRRANNESQSVEFLSESDRDISSSRQQGSLSPRISLQQGSRFFSQVKTSMQIKNVSATPTTTSAANHHATSTTAFERFNLFDFNQCRITEITELSSSQYSSSSFASSTGENCHGFENDHIDKVLARTSYCEVNKTSREVTEFVNKYGDSDISCPRFGKQTVKRGYRPSSEIHHPPSQNKNATGSTSHSYGNDDDDLESHMSSTGFTVSNSRQMSLTSDLSSDIPNTSSNLVATTGSQMEDYISLYFDENPSGNFSQQISSPQPQDLSPLQQADLMHSQQASNWDCSQDTYAQLDQGKAQITFPTTVCVAQNQSVAQPCADRASSSDANTNHRLCTSNQQQVSSQSYLPLVPDGLRIQRWGSYGGVESKKLSAEDHLDGVSWHTGVRDDGKAFLQPRRIGRSISNFEGGKYRGTGESIDHSYDFQNSIVLFIQMELCSQTLCEWLVERNDNMDLSTAYQDSMCHSNMIIFRQLLEGVDFIHSQGLIHRDLKPRNIFLSEKDLHVKIGDFGLAKEEVLGNTAENPILLSDSVFHKRHTTGVGTTGYAAPEQIEGSVYNAKSDMYSLGVVLFELFNVFTTDMERMENIKNPGQSKCLTNVQTRWPKQACAMCRLTDVNPVKRPLASELLKGELFVSPEQQIVALKQKIVEKDNLIESLKKEIKMLKAEKEELMGDNISF